MDVSFQRAKQTAWRTLGEETIVLDLRRKRMVGLNPAGARIWLALGAGGELDRLMAATEKDERAFGERQIAGFLDELAGLGLVEERTEGPRAVDQEPAGPASPAADQAPDLGPAGQIEPPQILWQEEVEQIAATCAFFPSTSPLCNQVPMS